MMRLIILSLLPFLLAAHARAQGHTGPSFDCTAAMGADEDAICTSPELSQMDLMIEEAYAGYDPEHGDATEIARALLADRRACGADTACIAAALYNALDTFSGIASVPAWVPRYVEAMMQRKAANQAANQPPNTDQPIPETVGQCAITKIAVLTNRLGEPLESSDSLSGTLVEFSNGGVQVSYSREEALAVSKVGEPAALCLLSIPRDCPPGDGRGRVYMGLNLFTQGSWVLSDSQHFCGGA